MTSKALVTYPPPSIREPYEFQRVGIETAVERGYFYFWDDPGLGKTMQAIIAAMNLDPKGPKLVVCLNSNKKWWKEEITTLYPEQAPLIAMAGVGGRFTYTTGRQHLVRHEVNICQYVESIQHVRWFIVHYEGIRLAKEYFKQIPWSVVILDECHSIKNRKAKRTQAIMDVTPEHAYRLGCTATPFGKNTADLWSQLLWMTPDTPALQSFWRFFNHFVDYSMESVPDSDRRYKKILGGKNLPVLAQLMAAYGLQRTKKQVAPQMPPIVDHDIPLALDGRQKLVYDALKDKNRVEFNIKDTSIGSRPIRQDRLQPDASFTLVKELPPAGPTMRVTRNPTQPAPAPAPLEKTGGVLGASKVTQSTQSKPTRLPEPTVQSTGFLVTNALSRLSKMEQWLSCPWEFDPGVLGAKMEYLLDWAKSYPYQAVIVSRFKASASRISQELGKLKGRHHKFADQERAARYVTGDIGQSTRDIVIDQWKAGKFQFLVGTIHTLGTGHNLQEGYAMVCYDQLYDPILMKQVHDRIHRINSDHPVEVLYLYVAGTTNDLILESFRKKWGQMKLVAEFLRMLQEGGNNDPNMS